MAALPFPLGWQQRKVEGDEKQQVAAGNIDPLAIFPEKTPHPGDDDNDRNGEIIRSE